MIRRLCKKAGCFNPTEEGSKYCSKHQSEASNEPVYEKAVRQPYQGYDSPNDAFYHSYKWRVLRAKILKQFKYCAICGSEENLTIHHIVKPSGNEELFFNEDNLQVLCFACHTRITQLESIETRKIRKQR